ncbi:PepSY-associated TM helix domain-containing protein [Roseobacter weihaiensis]|uniref:PepSY-associated TM helix domain-containing protein n=1 Tax=Roseobacter weihaiensis TaxID=2763262 RepID=UPI001D0ABF9A|nr:PepSY-associated TM helix domain-containing protein [Roseobacter sp. H9]
MSLTAAATKRLVALHGWSATTLAILLYVVMLTGTIVVLDNEITAWSEGRADRTGAFDGPVNRHVERLAAQVPPELHDTVFVRTWTGGDLSVFFGAPRAHPDGGNQLFGRHYVLAPGSGTIHEAGMGFLDDIFSQRPETALSQFLVDLHVRLHVPGRLGLYLTGLLGVAMLVAALTGILIHKHIIRDLFTTERPGGRMVSFRDRHTLAGVWSLPFAILLSFTGAFLSFAVSLGLPVVALVAFGGDQERAFDTVLGGTTMIEDSKPVPTTDLTLLIADARTRAGSDVGAIEIHHYGRADAIIETFHGAAPGALRGSTLEYAGATGAFLGRVDLVGSAPSSGSLLAELMTPLHFGNFGGLASRLVWVALGAAMTYTIISGMQLWLRRRADDPIWRAGEHVLVTVAWGLPLAIVVCAYGFFTGYLFGAPFAWTTNAFLAGCAAVILLAWLFRHIPMARMNEFYATALGIGILLLPLYRLQTGGLSWGEAMVSGGTDVLLIDMVCLTTAAACLTPALRRLRRRGSLAVGE